MIPPDTISIIFCLKNKRPDKWRDRPEPVKDNAERQIIFNVMNQEQADRITYLKEHADEN